MALMGLCFYRSGALDYSGLGRYQTGLGGQRLKSLIIESYNVEAVGVEFMPFGLRRFFPMSSMDLYGLVCSPQDVSDRGLMTLEELILSEPDIDECWNLLDSFFLSRLSSVASDDMNFKRISAALEIAEASSGSASVEAMADNACLSVKQFRRVFSEYVGIMPKGFLRLARHQRVMSSLLQASLNAESPSLEDLALSNGYYGASHLISDFKDIMGYAPSHLLKCRVPESYSWVDVEKTSPMYLLGGIK
jgi:Transcriptional regulator containing an amidase domain and an AraC-type DNA-binding HTH domain